MKKTLKRGNALPFLFSAITLATSGCNGKMFEFPSTGSTTETCSESGAPFGGGNGSASKPYLICTVAQLQNVSADLTLSYKLKSDLDLTAVTFNPLGTYATGFSGTFDGDSHTISNWTYAAADLGDAAGYPGPIESDLDLAAGAVHADFAVGFFRTLENGAVVKNFNLTNVAIKGRFYTGGMVGVMKTGSTLQDSSVTTSDPTGNPQTEMTNIIIGYNDHATGSTSGRTAGVVGEVQTGATITGATFNGLVRGGMHVSGVAGNVSGTVTNSHSAGKLVCRDGNCGGVVGNLGDTGITCSLSNSYSTMTLIGTNNGGVVGGVVGSINSALATATKLHFSGTINAMYVVGGVVGSLNGGTVTKSYAVDATLTGGGGIGGFVGWVYSGGVVEDSYAITNLTFNANSQWAAGGGAGFVANLNPWGGGGTLTRVYAAGTVTDGTGGLTSFADLAAVAPAGSTMTNSFADENITSNGLIQTSAGTVTGSVVHTTADMKLEATYTGAGWDFSSVWQISGGVNNGYPTLR